MTCPRFLELHKELYGASTIELAMAAKALEMRLGVNSRCILLSEATFSDFTLAINLLTPSVVLEARDEIRTGRSVQLDWALNNLQFPGFGRKRFEQKVIDLTHELDNCGFDDEIHINTQSGSQWDSLKHVRSPAFFGMMYHRSDIVLSMHTKRTRCFIMVSSTKMRQSQAPTVFIVRKFFVILAVIRS